MLTHELVVHHVLLVLHLLSDLVWIGSIVTVGVMLSLLSRSPALGAEALSRYPRRLYSVVCEPAFGASFLFGAALLSRDPAAYMRLHWMQGKLAFAIVVIALHHVIGSKTRKVAAQSMQAGASGAILSMFVLLGATAVVTFAIFRETLIP